MSAWQPESWWGAAGAPAAASGAFASQYTAHQSDMVESSEADALTAAGATAKFQRSLPPPLSPWRFWAQNSEGRKLQPGEEGGLEGGGRLARSVMAIN